MVDSIPKVIHYCWFGEQPHPPAVVRCMNSWRRLMPDYRIIEWNETNTDLTTNDYVREAYAARKYAFVSDYVRLKVLHDEGGLYMDTDVEVIKSLDAFLHHESFSGFEDEAHVPTAVMGARAGNGWIGVLLAEYADLHFVLPDGTYDARTNVSRITATTRESFGVAMNNSFQDIPGLLTIYPRDRFCPKSYATGVITTTRNTHAIHHFSGSWRHEEHRTFKRFQGRVNRAFGPLIGGWLLAVRSVARNEGWRALPGRALHGAIKRLRRLVNRDRWSR